MPDGSAAGQVLIWDNTNGKWVAATLTADTNITITNTDGTIKIAATGGGGGSYPGTILTDNFSSAGASALLWGIQLPTTIGAGGYVEAGTAVSGSGSLVLTPSNGSGKGIGFSGLTPYNMTGRRFSVKVAQKLLASAGVVETAISLAALPLRIGSFNYYRIIEQSGTLYFQKNINGASSTLASVTYSSVTHLYWGLSESGGTIFLETSSDGVTWTTRASAALELFKIWLMPEIWAGCDSGPATVSTAASIQSASIA